MEHRHTTLYEDALWSWVEEAKAGEEYVPLDVVYTYVIGKVLGVDTEEIKKVQKVWRSIAQRIKDHQGYTRLAKLSRGDYGTFRVDVSYWILAQGFDLYQDFLDRGFVAVNEYMKRQGVSVSDFLLPSLDTACEEALLIRLEPKSSFDPLRIRKIVQKSPGYTVSNLALESAPTDLIGVRITCRVARNEKGLRVPWQFDIDYLELLEKHGILGYSDSKSPPILLKPHGNLLASEDEIKTGIMAITVPDYLAITLFGGRLQFRGIESTK